MKLEEILSSAELSDMKAVMDHARTAGGGGFYFWCAEKELVIVGVCKGDELLTWFATPAHNQVEIEAAKHIVISGLLHTADVIGSTDMQSLELAAAAIAKAATKH